MSRELIINGSLPETRVVLMEEGEIQELLIERASEKGIVGNIYKGRVTRVLPGMQAAFVDIGLEKAAFLYVDDVYVHSEVFGDEAEDDGPSEETGASVVAGTGSVIVPIVAAGLAVPSSEKDESSPGSLASDEAAASAFLEEELENGDDDGDDEAEEEDDEPVEMGSDPNDDVPPGVQAPSAPNEGGGSDAGSTSDVSSSAPGDAGQGGEGGKRRPRRGRRGGKQRRRGGQRDGQAEPRALPIAPRAAVSSEGEPASDAYPESYYQTLSEGNAIPASDRGEFSNDSEGTGVVATGEGLTGRPEGQDRSASSAYKVQTDISKKRPEFKEQRSPDRRIRPKEKVRSVRGQVNIQDLLKEGQEVIVQVAKDPIATKGARLTCHISLPGRHLVCMPTIDHVGVSRRIERDDDRRRLREFVEKNRPRDIGFIVRTAGGKQTEKRIRQDIEYLTGLWTEIREKSLTSSAPSMIYEDLNPVLRAIRDWVTEEIDKVIVDSRYHFTEVSKFVARFMPAIRHKVEQYHGDIPIFDAYSISTELSRALERKVWLKSGGYIVIDQAEALVAIDVNTGRYVGKKSLEDTILKTNLEAVREIAYQLRLRNCGGIIILDLIDMERDENKQRVYRALEEELKKDRARPSILKISELGLIEMTRKRTRDTITRTMCESCSHCEGKGYIKSHQTVAYEILREIEREGVDRDVAKILVQAHTDVIDILAIEERDTVDQLEKRYRKQIYLQAAPDYHPEQFEVINEKKGRAERTPQPVSQRRPNERSDRDDSRRRGNQQSQSANTSGGAPKITIRPQPLPRPDTSLNGDSTGAPALEAGSGMEGEVPPNLLTGPQPGDEDFNEEDRLAFLRAQAAQDAALANLGAPGSTTAPRTNGGVAPVGTNGRPSVGAKPGSGPRDRDRGGKWGRGRNGKGGGRGRGPAPEGEEGVAAAPSRGIIPRSEMPVTAEASASSVSPTSSAPVVTSGASSGSEGGSPAGSSTPA